MPMTFFLLMCQHGMIGKNCKSPFFLIIRSFNRQRVLVALQRVQAGIVLHRAIVNAKKVSLELGVLGFSPISLHDLLHATGDGFRS
jgi:hypothetical protein